MTQSIHNGYYYFVHIKNTNTNIMLSFKLQIMYKSNGKFSTKTHICNKTVQHQKSNIPYRINIILKNFNPLAALCEFFHSALLQSQKQKLWIVSCK